MRLQTPPGRCVWSIRVAARSADDVQFLDLDIRNGAGLAEACNGVETVVHCASVVQTRNTAQDEIWEVNHGGTRNVLEACRHARVRKLVHISSASVVYEGRDLEAGDEELPYGTASLSAYADSKIAAEQDVLEFAAEGSTSACALRPHLVFGPGDTRFLPNILRRADGAGIREVGTRSKLSDFVYIDNVVDAVVAAETRLEPGTPVCGEAYFVTNGEPVAFFEFVERLLMAMGYPAVRKRVPYWLAYAGAGLVEAFHSVVRTGKPQRTGCRGSPSGTSTRTTTSASTRPYATCTGDPGRRSRKESSRPRQPQRGDRRAPMPASSGS